MAPALDIGNDPRQGPLAAMTAEMAAGGSDSVTLQPIGFRTIVNLRGLADDPELSKTTEAVFGVPLPGINRWAGDDERSIVWLGPDEWLLLAPDGEAAALEMALRESRPGDPWLSVVDVSHNYSGMQLSGPAAREVLAKGCPLDLHARAFKPGDCAQSMLAKTRALILLADDAPTFDIWVRNSFARYAAIWLVDAMREFRS